MKLKKVTALSLAVMMTVSALGACGSNEEKTETKVQETTTKEIATEVQETTTKEIATEITFPLEETVTFTAINTYADDNSKLAGSSPMKALEEMTNIHVEHIEILGSEWKEKSNMLIASGDYGDFFLKSVPGADKLAKDGIIIPLEDLIREYAPNLTAVLDKYDAWKDLESPDGHIYSLGRIGKPNSYIGTSYLYHNTAWLEAVGMESPTDMDELTDVLRAFRDNDVNGNGDPNDEIPLHLNQAHSWVNMQGFMTDGLHWYNTRMALMDEGEYAGQMVYYPRTEEFKENLLEYLILWYQEGLLDQNMFTTSYAQASSIGQTTNVYGMFWNTLASQAAPRENFTDYHTLLPFEDGYFPLNKGWVTGGFAITDKCENPELLVAWVDQLYTEEGGKIAFVGGKEGVDYVVNDDGTYTELEGCSRIHGYGECPALQPDLYYRKDRGEGSYQNDEIFFWPQEYGVVLPTIENTQEEADRIADIHANIDGYMLNYVASLMIGEISLEDTWDEFQAKLIDMGVEEMESLYQSGYDRYNLE